MSAGFWRTIGHDPATRAHASAEWQNLIDPEDLKIATQHAEDHFADAAKPYDMLVHYRSADGDTAAVRCKGIAVRDENGKPVRMLGAHVDVLDFVKQLRSYPEKGIKAFFGNVPRFMHSINDKGVLVSVSQKWARELGYEPDEMIGRKSTEFLTEASRKLAEEVVLPMFVRDGFVDNVPYDFKRRDGSAISVLMSAITLCDEDGGFIQSLAMMQERDEPRGAMAKARVELSDARMLLASVMDSTRAAIVGLGEDRRIYSANAAAMRMLCLQNRVLPQPWPENLVFKNPYDLAEIDPSEDPDRAGACR